jgi:4-oxalocrotonate tautomerase
MQGVTTMPLVRIAIPKTMTVEQQKALSDAVHEAMVETINVPAADRFQIITRHEPQDLIIDPTFLDVPRSDGATIIHITLRTGRTNDQKRSLYQRIAMMAEKKAEIRPADIMVVLTENTLPDWSFGNGVAHYQPAG